MSRRLFAKSYESFLEKIALGVAGVKKTIDELKKEGHNPIPMEKGTTSFKIWGSFKTKRFRVPDVVCLRCGKRFEVRAKTKPEISMSHSERDPDRSWDYGLTDADYVVITSCKKEGSRPIDWKCISPIHFVSVAELRTAYENGLTFFTRSKGREEGFERRLIWPTKFAKVSGKVTKVNNNFIEISFDSKKRKYSLSTKRTQNNTEEKIELKPLVQEDDEIMKNQIIASVADVKLKIPCNKQEGIVNNFIQLLSSSSRVDRFIGAKALRYFQNCPDAVNALKDKLNDEKEEKLVLYEVAVSLLELNQKEGEFFIRNILKKSDPYSIHEIIISLCDITPQKSFNIIKDVLTNQSLPEGVRVTAAWALGEQKLQQATDILIDTFNSMALEIKKEAARALFQISTTHKDTYLKELFNRFKDSNEDIREGLSWVIAKTLEKEENLQHFSDILDLMVDEKSKLWVSYILGVQDSTKYDVKKEEIKEKDERVYFAVNVLWLILRSWIWGLKEY